MADEKLTDSRGTLNASIAGMTLKVPRERKRQLGLVPTQPGSDPLRYFSGPDTYTRRGDGIPDRDHDRPARRARHS